MDYEEFIKRKEHSSNNYGFDVLYLPNMAFDFQKHIIKKAVKKGRMGVFADTGLGKTLISLSIAQNIILKTKKRVLIITPLAVAFQFLDEAKKLNIDNERRNDKSYT